MKQYTSTLYIFLFGLLLVPQVSFAAFDKIKGLLRDFKSVLDLVIPIVFTLAVLFFFWGVAQFIRTVSEKTKEEGKNKMIWGSIALFVMFSIWGIVAYIGNTLGIDTNIRSSTSSSSSGGGTQFDPCDLDPGGPNCSQQ